MSWSQRVIETLAQAKIAGMDFEGAWAAAVALHPPGRRDVGEIQLTFDGERDEYGIRTESMEEFLHRVSEDAWFGRKPLLRHMEGLLDMVAHDHAVSAVDGFSSRSRADMVA